MSTNYVFSKYSFPNPNNGERYDLSQDELVKLLDNAYNNGWAHAKELYDESSRSVTTAASYDWKEAKLNEC